MWHEYPYTDAHELNLDWFLARFKEYYEKTVQQDQKITTMEETVEQFTTFVTKYFDNLDVQQEINNKLDAMVNDGTIGLLLQPLVADFNAFILNRVDDHDEAINVLSARMDTFANLPNASTAGDAELADIRVGFNGVTYANAGTAVRSCDNLLDTKINSSLTFTPDVLSMYRCSLSGAALNYILQTLYSIAVTNRLATIPAMAQGTVQTSDLIPLGRNTTYTFTIANGYKFAYQIYKLSGANWVGSNTFSYLTTDTTFTTPNEDTYMAVTLAKTDDSTIDVTDADKLRFESGANQLKSAVRDLQAQVAHDVPVTQPFSMPYINADIYTRYGKYYVDYDLPKVSSVNMVTVFVSPDGNDSNDGITTLTPVKTLEQALSITNVTNIILLEGTYKAGINFTAGLTISIPVNMIGLGNVVIDNIAGAGNNPINFTDNCYIENINFKYGNNTVKATLGPLKIAVFYKCTFSNSDPILWSNGLAIIGGSSYVVKCKAFDNAYDGFNYHENGANVNYTYEIECEAYGNGQTNLDGSQGQSSNGSTTHAGSYIVRINGRYYSCHGGVVADLNSTSACYGCSAGISTVTNGIAYPDRQSNYWCSGGSAIMYLYSCESYGSRYDTASVSGATITSDISYPNNYTS